MLQYNLRVVWFLHNNANVNGKWFKLSPAGNKISFVSFTFPLPQIQPNSMLHLASFILILFKIRLRNIVEHILFLTHINMVMSLCHEQNNKLINTLISNSPGTPTFSKTS